MKKYQLLTLVPLMCLSSCAGNNIYGLYSFSMGKTTGTHMYASIEFTKESAGGLGNEKSFIFRASNNGVKSWIYEILAQGIGGGYSKAGINDKTYGEKIHLDALIDHEHYPEIIPDDIIIPSDVLDEIITVYWKGNITTMLIPVSLDDLAYQLAWYGYMVDTSSLQFSELPTYKLPGYDISKKDDKQYEENFMKNRLGKHPTVFTDDFGKVLSSQIVEMNNNFAYEFARTYVYNTGAELGKVGTIDNSYYFFPTVSTENTTFVGQVYGADIKFTVDRNKKSIFEEGYKITSACYVDGEKETPFDDIDYDFVFDDGYEFRDFHTVKIGLAREKKSK